MSVGVSLMGHLFASRTSTLGSFSVFGNVVVTVTGLNVGRGLDRVFGRVFPVIGRAEGVFLGRLGE